MQQFETKRQLSSLQAHWKHEKETSVPHPPTHGLLLAIIKGPPCDSAGLRLPGYVVNMITSAN